MTMKLSRVLHLLSLVLATAYTACTLQQTTPVKSVPAGVQSPPPQERQEAVEYATPQLAIGQEGRLYLLWLAVEYRKSWDVLFARSEDLGVTWSPPVSLKPDKNTVAGGIRIAAGPAGHVYATWREWDPKTKVRRLQFIRSRDHGMHWDESPRVVSASDEDKGMPQLLADQDGGVYLTSPVGSKPPRAIEVASSHDFGATFASALSRLATSFPVSSHERYGIMSHRFTSDGEGRLYVVWEETRAGRDHRIYLNRSLDRGKTWEAQPTLLSTPDEQGERLAYHPQIVATTNGRVYVVWEQDEFRKGRVGKPDRLIYVNRSGDYGQTWLPKPIGLNGTDGERVASLNPRLSSDRYGNVYAIWLEEEGPNRSQLFFSRSADSGLTWSAPTRLDLSSSFRAWLALAEVRSDDAGHVWVLWQALNPSPNGWQLLMNRSEDFGRSWSKQATVLTEPAQRGEAFRDASLQSDQQGRLYVAWPAGPQNPEEIAVNRSADFGATWLSRAIRVGRR